MIAQKPLSPVNDTVPEAEQGPGRDLGSDGLAVLEPASVGHGTRRPGRPDPGRREMFSSFTMGQFGRRAGISKWSVARRIKDGTIRAVRIGRLIRIPASEADRLLG